MWQAKTGFYGACAGGVVLFMAAGYLWVGPAAAAGPPVLLGALGLGLLLRCFHD
ncbi:hypothetical protein [Thiohalorhabdus denitrificans]|uniref:Uncharacterized protein n=1 Tax=Thiohalorhabdus denitrificans TaxID=381306 RepID=A0A1G5CKM1_9GAMM|nr:hypothetical protein [Thiohalorhabdus denitrificans]SCY02810.1 hypothetical protein SAMN05661077_1092 [Thiohalorhabdus denitrificans]